MKSSMVRQRIVVIALLALCAGGASPAATAALSGDHVDPIASGAQTRTPSSRQGRPLPPPADEFARIFVAATNRFAEEHGDRRRIGGADCVQAARGRYMCSYASQVSGAPRQCHLMQARWTPRAASTITITLAGRVEQCGSLREALDSL